MILLRQKMYARLKPGLTPFLYDGKYLTKRQAKKAANNFNVLDKYYRSQHKNIYDYVSASDNLIPGSRTWQYRDDLSKARKWWRANRG